MVEFNMFAKHLLPQDSARSCIKVARHFKCRAILQRIPGSNDHKGILASHGRCFMHMLAMCVADHLKSLKLVNPVFCGACLMQRGTARKEVRKHSHQQVGKLDIVFGDDPPAEHASKEAYLNAVLDQMDFRDERSEILLQPDDPRHARHHTAPHVERFQARKRLARNLAASVIEEGRIVRYVHWCPVGCHCSRKEVVDAIHQDMDTCHLDIVIPKPAINRWIKVFRPIGWWHGGHRMGYIPDAFAEICEPFAEVGDPLVDADTFGVGGDQTYAKFKQRRFKTTNNWLKSPHTGIQQGAGCTILNPAVAIMGKFFSDTIYGAESQGVMDFIVPATNPALMVIRRYARLAQPADPSAKVLAQHQKTH